LRDLGWDGSLVNYDGDYVMLVEANVGYNKASTSLVRSIRYEVDLSQSYPEAALWLTYENLNPPASGCEPGTRYDPTYEAMMDRCYWAYVRLYVPSGASLLDASEHPISPSMMMTGRSWSGEAIVGEDLGYMFFAQAALIPRGASETLSFHYRLPVSVLRDDHDRETWTYRLMIQKQAGLRAPDLQVSLRLPENAVPLGAHSHSATSQVMTFQDGVFFYKGSLNEDTVLSINYHWLKE
jgi:hypothetical protein